MNPTEWAVRKGLTEKTTDDEIRSLARGYLRFQQRQGVKRPPSGREVERALVEERRRRRVAVMERKRAREGARGPKSGDSGRPGRSQPRRESGDRSQSRQRKEYERRESKSVSELGKENPRSPREQYRHSRARYLENRSKARQHSRSSKVVLLMAVVVGAIGATGLYIGSPDSAVSVARDNSPRVWVLSSEGNITSVHKGYLRSNGLEPGNKDEVTMVPVPITSPDRMRVPVKEWHKGESLILEAKGGEEILCIVESKRGVVITRNSGQGEVRCESVYPG